MERRTFIKTSALTVTGASLAPILLANNQPISYPQSRFLSDSEYKDATKEEIFLKAKNEIPKIRKGKVEIKLVNIKGEPIKNLRVQVKLTNHAFLFGDCNPSMANMFEKGVGASQKLKLYREHFKGVMNSLNCTCYWTERYDNSMVRTEDFQGEILLESFEDSVNWANANGLVAKGHPLFWPVPKAIPQWMKKYPWETQQKFMEVRIRNMVSRFKGRVKIWDVVNEMLWEPAPKNLNKRVWPYIETLDNMVEYIAPIMQWVKEEDPTAITLLNEYGTETDKELVHDIKEVTYLTQRQRYADLINKLGDKGLAPDVMGLQSHTGYQNAKDQMQMYDWYHGKTGLPIHVTEFWAFGNELKKNQPELTDEQISAKQNEYVAEYLTCAFAHPAIDAFYFWGFMGLATEWRNDLEPIVKTKPMYDTMKDFVKKTWTTDEKLTTNSDGIISFEGYYGDYELVYPTNKETTIQSGFSFQHNKYQSGVMKFVINQKI